MNMYTVIQYNQGSNYLQPEWLACVYLSLATGCLNKPISSLSINILKYNRQAIVLSIISHRLFKIILKLRLQIWFPLNHEEETFLCLYYYVQAPFVIINVGRGRFFCQTRNDLSLAKGVVL